MMTIADCAKYQRHRQVRADVGERLLAMLLFASIGAITWAIRGTGGWGGMDGTILPGMSWGLLWCYLCHRKGIDAREIPLWLGLGIALGGELGYGQYVSWIQSMFNVGDEVISVAPWIGYVWFAICGIGWAAPGAIALGWALSKNVSLATWLVRLVLPVGLALAMRLVIQARPWLFFPNWDLAIYTASADDSLEQAASTAAQMRMIQVWFAAALLTVLTWAITKIVRRSHWWVYGVCVVAVVCTIILLVPLSEWLFFPSDGLGIVHDGLGRHLRRTVYTNSQNAIVLAWWTGAMLVAVVQRDWHTVTAGAVIGGGFGVGFPLAAVWCLGYTYAPKYIDWWKIWELNSGFYLGLLYVVVMYRTLRQIDRNHTPHNAPLIPAGVMDAPSSFTRWCETASKALGVFLIVYVVSREEFRTVGVLLGLFYTIALCLATRRNDAAGDPRNVVDRRRAISVTYSAFLLLFVMFWGASSQAGILLELYEAKDVDQYAWPPARVMLFAPACIVIVGATLVRMGRIVRGTHVSLRSGLLLVDLMTITGVVGAITIWPAKIGVLYALFLSLAVFSFNRLTRRFDKIDARPTRPD